MKAAREKQQTTYKAIPLRLTADIPTETLQASKSNWIVRPREKTCFSSEMDLYDSSIALNLLKYPKVLPYVNSPRKGFTH